MPLVRAPATRVLEWCCHFDTSRKEHVSDETAQTPTINQRAPDDLDEDLYKHNTLDEIVDLSKNLVLQENVYP